jgi:hypothetical protein
MRRICSAIAGLMLLAAPAAASEGRQTASAAAGPPQAFRRAGHRRARQDRRQGDGRAPARHRGRARRGEVVIRVMTKILALLLLIASVSLAGADAPSFQFDGERFVKKFEVAGLAPNAQIEFGLETETLPSWTKLVTIHSFPQGGNNAGAAAAKLANLVRERYKGAPYKAITNPKTSEAIIDFLIAVPNSELMEFNVFKYTPAGNALVALQFARRVKLGEIDGAELAAIRQRAIKEIAQYEMGPVKAYFKGR